jgi:hypothetical protein
MANRIKVNAFVKNEQGEVEMVERELTRKGILEMINQGPVPEAYKEALGQWLKFDFKVEDDGSYAYMAVRCTTDVTPLREEFIRLVLAPNSNATAKLSLKTLRNYIHRKDFVKRIQDLVGEIVTPENAPKVKELVENLNQLRIKVSYKQAATMKKAASKKAKVEAPEAAPAEGVPEAQVEQPVE